MWRRLGEDYVVYNEASGETHLPHPLSEWVLREVSNSPTSGQSLAMKLVSESNVARDVANSRIQEVLAELHDRGVIEPGSSVDC